MRAADLATRDLHRLMLGEDCVEYLLVRRRGRRGVGFKVNEDGLTVSAPLSMPLSRIEGLARESGRWIVKKLAEWRGREVPLVSWHDGARLPYLGGGLTLRIFEGARAGAERVGDELHVARRASGTDVSRVVIAWYKRVALLYLEQRARELALRAGIAPPEVFLSSAKARWGSCNSKREVRLAWRLIKAPAELVDYVVCHELAHLRHMNHSRAFWAEVERQCPAYRGLRERLFATDHLYRSF